MNSLKLTLTGTSPMLMHSERGANPLDAKVREHKKLTAIRKKTEDIHEKMIRSEWEIGLYHDAEIGPFLPTTNLRSCIVEGAKLSKLGASVKRATMILEDRAVLKYKGPREIERLWEEGRFVDVRSVVVGTSRVMRARPIFAGWSVDFTLYYDPAVLQEDQLLSAVDSAGKFIGLGDFRPACGGSFGRFEAKVAK